MNLSEIQNEFDKDVKIDIYQLDKESLRTPEIHHKYLKLHSEIKLIHKSAENKYKVCYRDKWEHYSGKGDRPYPGKLLKTEIPNVLEGDDELIKYKDKMEYVKSILEYLEEVIKILNNRSFHISNAIKFQQFSQGVD